MNRRLYPLLLVAFLLPMLSWGQVWDRNCATMDNLELLMQEDPGMEQRMMEIERFTESFLSNPANLAQRAVVTVPVVFHVVLNPNEGEAITDAQLQSQLDVLNEDFRRTNSDADSYWGNLGADTEIEFCLATVDPSGASTTGITRTNTTVSAHGTNNSVKFTSQGGKDAWNTAKYLNIWVCDIGGGILGYAQFPGGNAATDGIVLDYRYTGRGGSALAPFNLGRTGTHEVGHWFNLRHIWGDGPCGFDDGVADTPPSNRANYYCPIGVVRCQTQDMVQNYMDYTDDACMNIYTTGQKNRMQAALSGPRSGLLTSNGCSGGGGGGNHCTNGVQDADETGVDCGGADCVACPPPPTCAAPTGVSAIRNNKKNATVSWNAVSGASSYQMRYRPQGSTGSWTTKNTTSTSTTATGLANNSAYDAEVRTICGSNQSAWVATVINVAVGTRLGNVPAILVYPNPVQDIFTVEFTAVESERVNIRLMDIAGKTVRSWNAYSTVEEGYLDIPVQELKNGIYILQITDDSGFQHIEKVVVAR